MSGDLSMGGNNISDINEVTANTINAGEKNFDIPHPTKEGWRLRYSVLEGPERGVYIRGKATNNIIQLPEYWTELVYENSITVDLTPIGKACTHYITDINMSKAQITIGCDCDEINAYYVVFAERKADEPVWVEYKP